jgi:hypothetical protein
MRKIILLFLSLLIVGCATTIKSTYVDPTGRQLPVPHYVLQSTSDKMQATFYYALLKGKKDLDGTTIRIPTYLPLKEQEIQFEKNNILELTIELLNMNQSRYVLWETYRIVYENNHVSYCGKRLATTNFNYRKFECLLPYSKDIKKVEYKIEIQSKGLTVMTIGNFQYVLKK